MSYEMTIGGFFMKQLQTMPPLKNLGTFQMLKEEELQAVIGGDGRYTFRKNRLFDRK